MNILNQIKLFIAVFFIIHFTTNNCMLTRFKYEPMEHFNDETNIKRKSVDLWIATNDSILPKDLEKDVTNVRDATNQEKQGKCLAYAVNKITHGTAQLNLYTNNRSNIDIQKFFKQTQEPQKNGLAIYTPNKNDRQMKHFAVIIEPEKFESKFGTHPKISQHKPWSVPDHYGNAISFWTLKEKFTSAEGKKELHEEINRDIRAYGHISLPLFTIQAFALGIGVGKVLESLLIT